MRKQHRQLFQPRQRRHHRFVDRARALRTAKHEQRKLFPARVASPVFQRTLAAPDCRSPLALPAKVRQRLLKRNRRPIDKARQHAIGPTRQRVRLHHQRRSIRQRRRQHNRTRNITAGANDHVRTKLSNQPPRRNKTLRQHQRGLACVRRDSHSSARHFQ